MIHNAFQQTLNEGIRRAGGHKALANLLGLNAANLSNVKRGKRPMTNEQLEILGSLTDTDMAWLWAEHKKHHDNAIHPNPYL